MASLVGYKLKKISTDEEIQLWGGVWGQCPSAPAMIRIPYGSPGNYMNIHAPKVDTEYYGYIIEEWYMDDPPVEIPIISDRQFFQQANVAGFITQSEALAAVQTGTIPAAIQTVIDGLTDPNDKFSAQMIVAGATTFTRDHPLVGVIGTSMGLTSKQIDDFFIAASAL